MTPAELREQVAIACRVVALEGYVDLTLGHVSARDPGDRTIWIKRKGPALDEVTSYLGSETLLFPLRGRRD